MMFGSYIHHWSLLADLTSPPEMEFCRWQTNLAYVGPWQKKEQVKVHRYTNNVSFFLVSSLISLGFSVVAFGMFF